MKRLVFTQNSGWCRAGLACRYFIHQTLDATVERNPHWDEVRSLVQHLANLDDQWLIILDESHLFRNRYKKNLLNEDGEERLAFQRLVPAIERSRCKVLLLTGTPYAKELENVLHQLYLLPHTAPGKGQAKRSSSSETGNAHPWTIQRLEDLKDSPIGSVMTTPHVAKYYGRREGEHIAIDFHGGEKRYIPHVVLYRVEAPPFLSKDVALALDSGYFRVRSRWKKVRGSIERQVRVAWGSSPCALIDVINQVLAGTYHVTYIRSHEEQYAALAPLLNALNKLTWEEDVKLQWLLGEIARLRSSGQKVIIFSERYATVVYLEEALMASFPTLKLASTVKRISQTRRRRKFDLKRESEVARLLAEFDPMTATLPVDQSYEVLLTTDIFSVGVNLQNAQVVINYDLAWTPIEPAQRAGRILRLLPTPRTVFLYTLIPKRIPHIRHRDVSSRLFRRTEVLDLRHDELTALMELPTIGQQSYHEIQMDQLVSPVSITQVEEINVEEMPEENEVSSIFYHLRHLENPVYKKAAQSLPDDLVSAKIYQGKRPLLYILLWYSGKHYWPVYDIQRQRLLPLQRDIAIILKDIMCEPDDSIALVNPQAIERWGNACLTAWCQQMQAPPDQVMRICTLYLKPATAVETLQTWLDR